MELTLPIPAADTIMAFVLVLTRLGAVMIMAPLFSNRTVPVRVRAVVAVTLTVLLLPLVETPSNMSQMSFPETFALLLKEAAVGFVIGFAASIIVMAWSLGGAILDLMIGFSFGGVVDPIYGNQTSVIQQLYVLLAGVVFVSVNGDHWVLTAMARSFEKLPLNQAPVAGDFPDLAISAVTTTFVTGVGVVAPVFISLLLTDVAFGLVARAAPQTQIFGLEAPVKIAVALAILVVTLPLMVPIMITTLDRMLGLAVGGG